MLIDIRMEGKTLIIIGGGVLAERKARTFLQECPQVVVVSKSFTEGLMELEKQDKVKLVKDDVEANFLLFSSIISEADIIIAATDNHKLNTDIARIAREKGILVCAVDMPSVSDFYSPAVAQKGSIRVGVCTDGKSPLMSRLLRKRIEKLITQEDVLQVELQAFARNIAKEHIPNGERRRAVLYKIAQDQQMKRLLTEGQLDEAKKYATKIIKTC